MDKLELSFLISSVSTHSWMGRYLAIKLLGPTLQYSLTLVDR